MIFGVSYWDILIHGLGVLGIAATVIGFQCRKHHWVLGFRTANEVAFGLQYLLLGGYTGALLNFVGSVRNILFAELVKRGKSTIFWRVFFSAVFTAAAIFTWKGVPSVVFCVGKITTTFVYGSKNMTFVRIMTVVTSVMWIVYNLSIGAYEAIVSDSLTILSALIAIVRIDILYRYRQNHITYH